MERIKCIILVPLRRNDGSEVPLEELEEILDELVQEFGGCTVAGEVEGAWRSPEGVVLRDRNTQVWVAIEPSQLAALRRTVEKIGRQLGQEAMYLEVTQGTVETLPVSRRRDGRGERGRRR